MRQIRIQVQVFSVFLMKLANIPKILGREEIKTTGNDQAICKQHEQIKAKITPENRWIKILID